MQWRFVYGFALVVYQSVNTVTTLTTDLASRSVCTGPSKKHVHKIVTTIIVVVIKCIQRQYSAKDRNLRHISGW